MQANGGNGKHRKRWALFLYKLKKVCSYLKILCILDCVLGCEQTQTHTRHSDSGAAEACEGSRDESEWPGHYSATTHNSPQDKGSFVTGAAVTNTTLCVIKLADTLFPLCDTGRAESPRGEPVGESLLSDKHIYGYGQEGLSIIGNILGNFEILEIFFLTQEFWFRRIND